jgi:hypothetical protein
LPTLRILGHKVIVSTVSRTLAHERKGESEPDACSIRIVEGLEASVYQATLLHEIVHCIDDYLDIGLSEDQVCGLAQGLFQVLEDNPSLLRKR